MIVQNSKTVTYLELRHIQSIDFSIQEPLQNLQSLKLDSCSEEVTTEIIANVRNLKEISLIDSNISASDVTILLQNSSSTVEKLHLGKLKHPSPQIPTMPNLETLRLKDCSREMFIQTIKSR